MIGFIENLSTLTRDNRDFRRVVYTANHLQLVLMSIEPGGEIGSEVHVDHDQFFLVESGEGAVSIDGATRGIAKGDAVIVPAGARHNVTNTGAHDLKLFTLYGPPDHRDGVVHHTILDAVFDNERFDGEVTEPQTR